MGTVLSRWHLVRAGLLLAAAQAAACTAEGPSTAGVPESGGTAAVGVSSRPTTLLPPFATSALDGELGPLLYLGLNFAEWEDGELRYLKGHPLSLAREWEIDGERLIYRLDMSRGWSDGAPITARDVVFTYELLGEMDDMPMSIAAARIDSVVATDDSTVVFHFEAAYPGMLYDTGVGILPEHVFGGWSRDAMSQAGLTAGEGSEGPVVSGPFTIRSWGPGDQVNLVPNERSAVRPRLSRLILRVEPDPVTRLSALRAGELDLVQVESYREAARLVANGEVAVLRVPQRGYDYLSWNPDAHPALDDVTVRQALSLAIDRDLVLAALDMTEFADKAYGPYGSIFRDLAPPPPPGGDHDPDRARELLAEAGWVDTDGDGVRERDGTTLALELRVPAEHERRLDAAQIIQAQLIDVGVRIEIVSQEFNSLFARARARDYDAVFLGWQVGLDPDISFFWSDPGSPVNVASYDSDRAREHMQAALASATAEEAAPHWREAAAIIAADYPFAFLWYFDFVWLKSDRLDGVHMDPVGFLRNPHEWTAVRSP